MQWFLKARLTCTLIIVASSNCALGQNEINAADLGEFSGPIVVQWIEHDGPDRKMVVMEPVNFRESSGREWQVPVGAIVDGASIPRFLWSFGSPFVGDYRRASIVHDYFCQTKSEPWQDVHRMFYLASLASGVSKSKATIMYLGVRGGNRRWTRFQLHGMGASKTHTQTIVSEWTISEEQFNEIVKIIELNNPSLDEIDVILDSYESKSH